VRRSLRKSLRQRGFVLTTDSAFSEVIDRCAEPRASEAGTWITPQMRAAYTDLHRAGHAHSVETWQGGQLVGGLYGIAIGQAFFGESMFSRVTDASKAALVALARVLVDRGYRFIDCQVSSEHLLSLGARNIPRALFVRQLQQAAAADTNPEHWAVRFEGAELA
jgi:leucyl/phenylalanyl-tRNA--protein transferase